MSQSHVYCLHGVYAHAHSDNRLGISIRPLHNTVLCTLSTHKQAHLEKKHRTGTLGKSLEAAFRGAALKIGNFRQ